MTYVLIAQYCALLGPFLKIRLDPPHTCICMCVYIMGWDLLMRKNTWFISECGSLCLRYFTGSSIFLEML